MFGLSKHGPDSRYGVVVDVGSSTVTAAIVLSDPDSNIPVVVWSYKERVVLKEEGNKKDSIKGMISAIMNTFLQIGSEGISVLSQYDKHASLEDCNVAIAAPWSYSVTQKVRSESESPFKISSAVLEELESKAKDESEKAMAADDLDTHLGLTIISEKNLSFSLNGYLTADPYGKHAKEIILTLLVTAVENSILSIIKESQEKVLPRTRLNVQSFMTQFFATIKHLEPKNTDFCLVDIGGEATELGIVRDGELSFVTHCTYGTHTLARALTEATGGSFSEVLSSLQHEPFDILTSSSQSNSDKVKKIELEQYKTLADLFTNTGDSLSIPKEILLHTDSGFEKIGQEAIEAGSKRATNITHNVRNITAELFAAANTEETKILLSSYVFHKRLNITKRSS